MIEESIRCSHFATILKDISVKEAHGVFWGLFAATIVLMTVAASCYGSKAYHEAIYREALDDPEEAARVRKLERNLKQSQLRCLAVSIICCLLQIVTIIFQSFAGLSLHFCHHEELVMFLWSTWSVLSLGSFVATLGIVISMFRTRNPPWNIPLGTPVLVFAGLGHIFLDWLRNVCRKEGDYQFPHAYKGPYATHRRSRVVMAMRTETAERVLQDQDAVLLFRGPEYTMYFFDRLENRLPPGASNDLELPGMSHSTTTAKWGPVLPSDSSPSLNQNPGPEQVDTFLRPDSAYGRRPS